MGKKKLVFDKLNESKILRFNKLRLLDGFEQLRNSISLYELRQSIEVFEKHILHPFSSLRKLSSKSSFIEYKSEYLINELQRIASSKTLERSIYYIERFIRSITEVKTNSINDINLNRWKEYDDIHTDSLWIIDRRDNSGPHTAGYWGNFVPQIPNQMMMRYTKKGDWVLDTFAGSGTTLIEARKLGRNSIGIELQNNVVELARGLIAAEFNRYHVINEIIPGDCVRINYRKILKLYNQDSVQLAIMHPPYFDIIKFSDDMRDLSNAASVDIFIQMLVTVARNVSTVLDTSGYLILVIGDKYTKKGLVPLGFLAMNAILKQGFLLKGIIVKNFEETVGKRGQKDLWKYRALVGGFYIFKHEYIFVFEKQ